MDGVGEEPPFIGGLDTRQTVLNVQVHFCIMVREWISGSEQSREAKMWGSSTLGSLRRVDGSIEGVRCKVWERKARRMNKE